MSHNPSDIGTDMTLPADVVAALWVTEPRIVPVELTPDFDHATYTPEPTVSERMAGVPLSDRIDDTMRTRLRELGYL